MYLVSDSWIEKHADHNARVAMPLRRIQKRKYAFTCVPNWRPVGLYAMDHVTVLLESSQHDGMLVNVAKHEVFLWDTTLHLTSISFPHKFAWCYVVYQLNECNSPTTA